jgi:hypothetical protein
MIVGVILSKLMLTLGTVLYNHIEEKLKTGPCRWEQIRWIYRPEKTFTKLRMDHPNSPVPIGTVLSTKLWKSKRNSRRFNFRRHFIPLIRQTGGFHISLFAGVLCVTFT